MTKFNKFWAALVGTIVIALHESGVVDTGQAEALVNSGVALLTAFGVYLVPNKS